MNARKALVWLVLLTALSFSGSAFAVKPNEMLANPALEARARTISESLRCLVCQNQSIDESDADLARDLRVLVRERITAGDSNAQVIDYVVSRYGEFVLLKPRLSARTLLLWGTPIILLLAGGLAMFIAGRRRRAETPALTSEEQARLDAILRQG
ncbi:MAG TPA: cytochrome c-type biogenesis protein [Mesorhizobium sp.]